MLLGGCQAVSPTERFDLAAARLGLVSAVVPGQGFDHRVYRAPGAGVPESGVGVAASAAPHAGRASLHIYFGGDGTPFVTPGGVARDPTARRPLTLELMHAGPRPAVYIGRPCYHGLTDGCDPTLWTSARYAEPIVASLAAAVRRVAAHHGTADVVLVGYSGGGTLALLVAERLPEVRAVATLAANLDVAAWTLHHGFTPLTASLDPVAVAGSRSGLLHRHWSGADDDNVPPAVHLRLQRRLPAGSLITMPGFDHRCCWVRAWPALAAGIDSALTARARAPGLPSDGRGPAPDGSPGSRPAP